MKHLIIVMALALSSCCTPAPKAYYLYASPADSAIYVINDLGDSVVQVGRLSDWDDPESILEVLETQIGWDSPLAASQAYMALQED